MNKVRLTPEAGLDLNRIHSYIAKNLNNPTAAAGVVRKITKSLRVLERFCEAGPSLEAKTGYPSVLRFLPCGSYLAFYQIDGEMVSISRILHSRQDYMLILFGDQNEKSNYP